MAHGNVLLQQKASVKILEIFDILCREFKWKYWVGAGNLLGLVRHNGGFIPWDDDIDVYMMRDDFEEAVKLLPALFNNTKFGCVYRGFSLKFLKFGKAAISFDIFPIDQYYKKLDSEAEKDLLIKKLCSVYTFSRQDYFKAAGFDNNDDFFTQMWNGAKIADEANYELKKLSKITKNKWEKLVMENNPPAPDGHLTIGYERVGYDRIGFKGNSYLYTWKYDYVFPLQRSTYCGIEVNIPYNPDLYLFSQYGDYWDFPNEFHKHTSRLDISDEFKNSITKLINIDAKEFCTNLIARNTHLI
jgi:lipopolysaccharide cholinephosphotransferase